jgi:hypothetical protein
MPVISRFFGIVVFMNWREHSPPHFHAKYGDDEVIVEIETGRVTGSMARRAVAMVQEWRQAHHAELLANWARAEQRSALNRIAPLE